MEIVFEESFKKVDKTVMHIFNSGERFKEWHKKYIES